MNPSIPFSSNGSKGFFEFSNFSLSSNAYIQSATLKIWKVNSGGSRTFRAARITQSIGNWYDGPGSIPTTDAGSTNTLTNIGDRDFDATEIVRSWVAGEPNFGIALEPTSGSGTVEIGSALGSVSFRAKLTVVYDIRPVFQLARFNDPDPQRSKIFKTEIVFNKAIQTVGTSGIVLTNLDTNDVFFPSQYTASGSVVTIDWDQESSTLTDGDYEVEVLASGFMTSLGAHPASDSVYTHVSLFQWYGDCDGDRFTDFVDFSDSFLPAFGTEKGVDAEYVEELDGQPDDFVDFTDFADFFLPKFGTGPDNPLAEPQEFPQ